MLVIHSVGFSPKALGPQLGYTMTQSPPSESP